MVHLHPRPLSSDLDLDDTLPYTASLAPPCELSLSCPFFSSLHTSRYCRHFFAVTMLPTLRTHPTHGDIVTIKDEWLSKNPSDFLALNVGLFGDVFHKTNCELTALCMRISLTGHHEEWRPCNKDEMLAYAASQTRPQCNMYQVTIHEFSPAVYESQLGTSPNHIFTVLDGHIIQSYFGQYEWKVSDLDAKCTRILNSGQVTSLQDWFTLTGASRISLKESQYIWFWIPEQDVATDRSSLQSVAIL